VYQQILSKKDQEAGGLKNGDWAKIEKNANGDYVFSGNNFFPAAKQMALENKNNGEATDSQLKLNPVKPFKFEYRITVNV